MSDEIESNENTDQLLEHSVWNHPKKSLDGHFDLVLAQYKVYADFLLQTSETRRQGHQFFIVLNTAMVAAYAVVGKDALGILASAVPPHQMTTAAIFLLLLALAGVALCIAWAIALHRLICSCGIRYKIMREIESVLPVAPLRAEEATWHSTQWVEYIVPVIFTILHGVIVILAVQGLMVH
jgi:hypothetical protein